MSLYLTLLSALTLGNGAYIRHCRQAPQGCEPRVAALTKMFDAAGQVHQVPRSLLAAIAYVESGLDPFRSGPVGEFGVMQLNPRRAWRRVPFRKRHVRQRCRRVLGACQKEVIYEGARWLRLGLNICGSKPKALTWYNTGTCGTSRYSRRVMRVYNTWGSQ